MIKLLHSRGVFTPKALFSNPSSHFSCRYASSSSINLKMESEFYTFGPYKINQKEVFYSTALSYALVNLKPVIPGNVLVCPRREVKRFVDLTVEETSDLWLAAQNVGNRIEHHYNASSLTFSIQDGPQAGQTVPHVHIHILPRKSGDFKNNDEIYDAVDVKEKELKEKLDLDKERKERSFEEMAQEADELRKLFA
ncbi:bifunctional bis(5'-adenosyl)-triphosphatase/adenylylsulfatase FHIT isoform X1 [Magnolia sinica]|uniref:bifunctional bis(5'-adenosyl)-triphosphatase/adenylylsulfatase FHIT isoform X1 n=1 Tax=Magnolia sinica TaxID=86752 RepID=UPI00265AAD9B|nr:bifunctional bis(5'-adenosyl)-triphosphatase/adenylylsulfatase FHIT isoform X1 [Magnolia sinica]